MPRILNTVSLVRLKRETTSMQILHKEKTLLDSGEEIASNKEIF